MNIEKAKDVNKNVVDDKLKYGEREREYKM